MTQQIIDNGERAITRSNPAVTNRGIEVQSFEELWRLATAISKSGFAPKSLDSPEAVFIAVQMGLELGLRPMAAMRAIAVINGRPSIYGDAALALVRASGLLAFIHEETAGGGDSRVAICSTQRVGSPKPRTTRFSVEDAKKAGVWNKAGPWTQYPARMLMWRARGFNLRDEFGDVLQGLPIFEEAQDIPAETAKPKIADRIKAAKVEMVDVQTSEVQQTPAAATETPAPTESKQDAPAGSEIKEPPQDFPAQCWGVAEDLKYDPDQFKESLATALRLADKDKKTKELTAPARAKILKEIMARSGVFAPPAAAE